MSWQQTTLGEIADIVSGSTPKSSVPRYWDGAVAWATPTDLSRLDGKHLDKTDRTITEAGLNECSARLLPPGSVLFSSRAPIGLVAINTTPMATNQGFKSFVPRPDVNADYLYWWLRANRRQLEDLGNGATFKEVSKAVVSRVKFPLPPLDEQRRIAAILDKADAIRRKREQALTLADDFLRSVFLEMFGDPVNNPLNWPLATLGEICSKITDGTHDTPPRQSSGFMFLTGKNIRPFRIDTQTLEFVSEEVHREIFRRCNPEFGDVLFTNIGAGTGNAVFNELTVEFSMKNVALLKPDSSRTNGRYLESLLNHDGFKDQLLGRFGQGGAQGFLGLKTIKSIEVPLPPVELQDRFYSAVEKTKILSSKVRNALNFDKDLFSALSQRAFAGEL